MKTDTTKRFLTLILPLTVLFLFVGLFVGSSITRTHMRKELTEMKETFEKREDYGSRLEMLKQRNRTISYIIGSDEEIELLINAIDASN